MRKTIAPTGWNEEHSKKAQCFGFDLFNEGTEENPSWRIQKDDERNMFATDADAIHFCVEMAYGTDDPIKETCALALLYERHYEMIAEEERRESIPCYHPGEVQEAAPNDDEAVEYTVERREVWVQKVKVRLPKSKARYENAIAIVEDGGGAEIDNTLEYSDTLHSDTWTVEGPSAYDSRETPEEQVSPLA